jgi:hypothetical protein
VLVALVVVAPVDDRQLGGSREGVNFTISIYAKPYDLSLIVDRVRGQHMQCCVGGDERVQIGHCAVPPQERARVPGGAGPGDANRRANLDTVVIHAQAGTDKVPGVGVLLFREVDRAAGEAIS